MGPYRNVIDFVAAPAGPAGGARTQAQSIASPKRAHRRDRNGNLPCRGFPAGRLLAPALDVKESRAARSASDAIRLDTPWGYVIRWFLDTPHPYRRCHVHDQLNPRGSRLRRCWDDLLALRAVGARRGRRGRRRRCRRGRSGVRQAHGLRPGARRRVGSRRRRRGGLRGAAMSPLALRFAGFVSVLAVLFVAGVAAGGIVDPDAPGDAADAHDRDKGHGGGGEHAGMSAKDMDPVRGLAVAEGGLRLEVDDAELRRDRPERLRFRIVDERGRAVRDFDVEHTKRMHLIVARRDLARFQHLHPAMEADGTWTVSLRLPDAGTYRVFADFAHEGAPRTLATDLQVDGSARLDPLPAPAPVARPAGGYDVRLDADRARAGREGHLGFAVTKDGRPVSVEPYLGADGHLVVLREGDLAFLHVHPSGHGRSIGFGATFPSAGRYRMFLQFQVAGHVETAAFTQEVR